MKLIPLDQSPPTPPAGVADESKMHFVGRDFLRVRLKLGESSSGPVSVRPWFYLDEEWWPLRADGADGVGVQPVTADPSAYDGKADGFFVTGGLASFVVLVLESGDGDDVESAYVDASDSPG